MHGAMRRDRRLEQPRVATVRVEIGGQPDRVGREARRLHESHPGVNAERARLVGRGRRDAAADVVAQRRRTRASASGAAPAAADHHGLAAQLRVAQELDRRVERIHVEVRDAARAVDHGEPVVGAGCATATANIATSSAEHAL